VTVCGSVCLAMAKIALNAAIVVVFLLLLLLIVAVVVVAFGGLQVSEAQDN